MPHGVNACAIAAARVLQATVFDVDFGHSLLRHISFSAKPLEAFCARLSKAERWRILTVQDGRSRLEESPLYFAKGRGRDVKDRCIPLCISHTELATFAAMTRPHTTVLRAGKRIESGLAKVIWQERAGDPINRSDAIWAQMRAAASWPRAASRALPLLS